MRSFIRIALLLTAIVFAAPAYCQVHLNVTFGPPAARQEVIVTQPTPNAVWIPGYYQFNALTGNYSWVAGHWAIPPNAGYTWTAPRYVRHGNHYDYYAGNWSNPGLHKGWYKNGKAEEKEEAHEKHER